MLDRLFPIGSVVLLKDSTKKVMIIGVCQKEVQADTLWDYAGCVYPEGYMGADQTFLFNNNQIDKVFAVGYQDEEQFEFKIKADALMEQLRAEGENEKIE